MRQDAVVESVSWQGLLKVRNFPWWQWGCGMTKMGKNAWRKTFTAERPNPLPLLPTVARSLFLPATRLGLDKRRCHHPINQIKNLIYYSPGLGAATVTNYSAVSTQGNNNVGATQEKVPTSDKPSQQWLVLPVKFTIHPTLPPLCLHVFVIMGKPLFLMLYSKSARLPVTATYDILLDDTNKGSSVASPNVYAKALFGIFFTMAPPAHQPLPPTVCFRQIPVSKVDPVLRSCLLKKYPSFIITEY